ncbi:uracil-DNA glycosylase [Corynebacterium sp. zg254]|uniref:Uracil-DNA glycosylase n=1 Tax=Corynebacterium zhongnanshanii TaxID=2768834 RepID=A0ABQ6VFW7_9CORY|nr:MULTISPECIES: uracil-DNA glycosylase [Corynebacterium]KAB3523300.1 uracil-DNA glycosylase [Corynebacterium zhongnanshanii]MCR5913579.1 uracil-DNA glycosylase [Corynebacterium sp. zg254]
MSAIHPAWELPDTTPVLQAVRRRTPEERTLPASEKIMRAFRNDPRDVRVVIVGQDPYPTPGDAMGLAFSSNATSIPKSLRNIYKEYEDDLGLPAPQHGDISAWADRGVLLLNRVLTVEAGQAGAHRNLGWEAITEAAVRQVARNPHLVAILWGKAAQSLAPIIGEERCICSPHPSPLSAYRGFFGSKPFSRANALLQEQGGEAIDWRLPA